VPEPTAAAAGAAGDGPPSARVGQVGPPADDRDAPPLLAFGDAAEPSWSTRRSGEPVDERFARHVEFVDEPHQAGVVVAARGATVLVATCVWRTLGGFSGHRSTLRMRIGGRVVVGRVCDEVGWRTTFVVATLPEPLFPSGRIALGDAVAGRAFDVVLSGSQRARAHGRSVSRWSDGGGARSDTTTTLHLHIRSRPPLGAGVYDDGGRFVGVWQNDELARCDVLSADDLDERCAALGSAPWW
jgi:hypothetical protein